MLKHYINYIDNTYYVEEDGVIVLSVELNTLKNQVIIRAPKDVYVGEVELLTFGSKVGDKS